MKIYLFSFAIILIAMSFSCDVSNQQRVVDITPHWDSLRVLENPHKGWYHHLLDNGIAKYSIKDEKLVLKYVKRKL